MRIKKLAVISAFVVTAFFILFIASSNLALAQGEANNLLYGGTAGGIGERLGLGGEDPRILAANIIRVFLGFLGIIAVGLTMYAGWLWMTSEGNEEKVLMAQKILKNAVIGLVIILLSFSIATFVLNRILGATGIGGPGASKGPGAGGGLVALGSGIIQSHYPERNQKDIPRNTKIVITFKEPMDASTIMSGDSINADNIKIYKTVDGVSGGPFVVDVTARKTEDNKTFVFKPNQYLGSPSENIWYTVALSKNISKANGEGAFPGVIGDIGYDWAFEVSTNLDLTPPKVESVIPYPGDKEPRNVIIQINFDEAIDPTSSSGRLALDAGSCDDPPKCTTGSSLSGASFKNIEVGYDSASTTKYVAGNFYISNQYKTVEFLTEVECGTNSCGETVYCLPGDKALSTLVRAATNQPISFPYDGLVDMADNSLDGNKNGSAQGPQSQSGTSPYNENSPDALAQGDDYIWFFSTDNTIDITAPKISRISPNINEHNVDFNAIPEATFDKLLMSGSLVPGNSVIMTNITTGESLNYWLSKTNNREDRETAVEIRHDQFNDDTDYGPEFKSSIKDVYQNCYSPCSGINETGNFVAGTPSCCEGNPTSGATCP